MSKLKWSKLDDEDNNGAVLWALIDDGTDLYIIQYPNSSIFWLVERVDAREPNAGYEDEDGPNGEWIPKPDDVVSGPFATLTDAKLGYFARAFEDE